MIKFDSVSSAIQTALNDIRLSRECLITKAGKWQATDGFHDYEMRVLINYDFTAPAPQTIDLLQNETKADQPWSEVHFKERISGMPLNPGISYKSWPYNTFKDSDDKFKNENNMFSHTYMERYWPRVAGFGPLPHKGIRYEYGDLGNVIIHLKENKLTRQAYLPIWFPEDTGITHGKRVPCTLGYHFFIVDEALHCNYYIRSCDAFRHFRNDIYLTIRLMQYVSECIELYKVGNFTMYIANFHIFKNDLYALNKREKSYENI